MKIRTKLLRLAGGAMTVGAVFFASAVFGLAQEQAPPPPPPHGDVMYVRGPMGGDVLHGDLGEGKTVTGVPLTADFRITHDNTLADGNRIHKENTTRLYRDSQGRVRREVVLSVATPTTGNLTRTMVMINDPVAGKRYMLDTETKTARELPMGHWHGRGHGKGMGIGAAAGIPLDADVQKIPMSKSVSEQDLGTKSIDGFTAEGLKVTRTIAAGEIGNEKPIDVVTERWYAPDLQVPVLITHSDPMMGTMTTKLTSVTKGEPDASLFQVPSDYKVVTAGPDEPFHLPPPPK